MKGSVEWSSIVDEGTGAREGISGQEQHWGRGNRSKRRDQWTGAALWMREKEQEQGSVERSSILDEGRGEREGICG